MERDFYFPLFFLNPDFESEIRITNITLVKRKWDTSIFDLATLASKHKLYLPYQIMDVMLSKCNCELIVHNAKSPQDAVIIFNSFRLGLYAAGVSPFISPFYTSVSVNDYSGVNERDTAIKSCQEPKIPSLFNSYDSCMEAWPFELTFQSVAIPERCILTQDHIIKAAEFAKKWNLLRTEEKQADLIVDVLSSACMIGKLSQSLLHLWTGIESIFPTVTTEVSFKISLYLSVLCAPVENRIEYHKKIKSAYSMRSKIAHGANVSVYVSDWCEGWGLIIDCLKVICANGHFPQESNLIENMFLGK